MEDVITRASLIPTQRPLNPTERSNAETTHGRLLHEAAEYERKLTDHDGDPEVNLYMLRLSRLWAATIARELWGAA